MKEINAAIDALNQALKSDPAALKALLEFRVPCNRALADHPTVQVAEELHGFTVGTLGILNGIIEPITGQRIAVHINEATGEVVRFSEFNLEVPA